ncbi:MAG: hypothetical protein JXQ73_11945 [Phycisphaerae bacterium]|nr:hypothetical protein [Phycisphaerae bacterium]
MLSLVTFVTLRSAAAAPESIIKLEGIIGPILRPKLPGRKPKERTK